MVLRQVFKSGNSLVVGIPQQLALGIGITKGTYVQVELKDAKTFTVTMVDNVVMNKGGKGNSD